MNRRKMIEHLKSLGLENAIADTQAVINNVTPAILLRWNGREEYYTGQDMGFFEENTQLNYRKWLVKTFRC